MGCIPVGQNVEHSKVLWLWCHCNIIYAMFYCLFTCVHSTAMPSVFDCVFLLGLTLLASDVILENLCAFVRLSEFVKSCGLSAASLRISRHPAPSALCLRKCQRVMTLGEIPMVPIWDGANLVLERWKIPFLIHTKHPPRNHGNHV